MFRQSKGGTAVQGVHGWSGVRRASLCRTYLEGIGVEGLFQEEVVSLVEEVKGKQLRTRAKVGNSPRSTSRGIRLPKCELERIPTHVNSQADVSPG
jgi:hypothetical protein